LEINNVPLSSNAAANIMLGEQATEGVRNQNDAFNSPAIELIVSYYHHLVVRRKVKNPFEHSNIIGIHNYIDMGLELVHKQQAEPQLKFAAGWQINKNSLIKFKLSEQSVSGAYSFKSWFSPSASLAATITHSFNNNNNNSKRTELGVNFSVENFGAVLFGQTEEKYKRTVDNIRRPVTNNELLAQPNY
jgi:hypothetical protein